MDVRFWVTFDFLFFLGLRMALWWCWVSAHMKEKWLMFGWFSHVNIGMYFGVRKEGFQVSWELVNLKIIHFSDKTPFKEIIYRFS